MTRSLCPLPSDQLDPVPVGSKGSPGVKFEGFPEAPSPDSKLADQVLMAGHSAVASITCGVHRDLLQFAKLSLTLTPL